MSSRIVYIRRKPNNTNIPEHIYAESKRRIGSSFTKSGQTNKGLTFSEEKELLPALLGLQHSDPNFYKTAESFFSELTIEVDHGQGTKLDASTDQKGNPINLMDYIKYKFALAHPFVAADSDACMGSRKFKYFLHDPSLEMQEKHSALEVKKKAYREFIKASADEDKMDMILLAMGSSPKGLSPEGKELKLEHEVEADPASFLKIVTDKNLEQTAFIESCISHEVLRRVGTAYLNGDEKIGDTLEETLLFLKNKKNSEVLTVLKARLKSFTK
jgi:hypothetical protein